MDRAPVWAAQLVSLETQLEGKCYHKSHTKSPHQLKNHGQVDYFRTAKLTYHRAKENTQPHYHC